MFLFKFFGVLDIFVAFLLFLGSTGPFRLIVGAALYLIVKGLIFKGELLSAIDLVIGIYCLITILLPVPLLSLLAAIYLSLKGIYSLAF